MAKNRDHHANQKNPNNSAHKAAQDNRANQLNPTHPASPSGREGNQPPARKKVGKAIYKRLTTRSRYSAALGRIRFYFLRLRRARPIQAQISKNRDRGRRLGHAPHELPATSSPSRPTDTHPRPYHRAPLAHPAPQFAPHPTIPTPSTRLPCAQLDSRGRPRWQCRGCPPCADSPPSKAVEFAP